jgi:iron(III) transport system permease protein
VPVITLLGFITYYTYKKSNFLIPIIIFPLAIPSAVIGISLVNLYNVIPLPIYGTVLIVVLGYILRFLPFSIFIFSAFCPQLSKSIEESAKLSKSSYMKIFYKIILPLTKNGFLASIFIIFIFCLGEIGITQMVAPPGFQTLSNRIDTLMHYGNYPYVASLSLLLLLFIFLFYGLYLVVYRYGRRN